MGNELFFDSRVKYLANKYLSPVRNTEVIVDMMPISENLKSNLGIWGQRAYLNVLATCEALLAQTPGVKTPCQQAAVCAVASSLGSLFQRPSLVIVLVQVFSGDEYPPMALISVTIYYFSLFGYTVRFSSSGLTEYK